MPNSAGMEIDAARLGEGRNAVGEMAGAEKETDVHESEIISQNAINRVATLNFFRHTKDKFIHLK